MGDDVQPVHYLHASLASIGQPQTSANGLLDQRARIGRAQRHDGVEVGHVPALFEHVDVDDDLGRLVVAFHRQQLLHDLVALGATGRAAVDLDHLARIAPAEQLAGNQPHQLARVRGVTGDHQHEGLDRLDPTR